jgi:hypothetical protein
MNFKQFLNESDSTKIIKVPNFVFNNESFMEEVQDSIDDAPDDFDFDTDVYDYVDKSTWDKLLTNALTYLGNEFKVKIKLINSYYGDYNFPWPDVELLGTKESILDLVDFIEKKHDQADEMDIDTIKKELND